MLRNVKSAAGEVRAVYRSAKAALPGTVRTASVGQKRKAETVPEDSPQPDTAKEQGGRLWPLALFSSPMPAGMTATAILTGTSLRTLPDLRRRIAMERGQPYSPPCTRCP